MQKESKAHKIPLPSRERIKVRDSVAVAVTKPSLIPTFSLEGRRGITFLWDF
jgi:hypothetical protein